MYAVWKSSTLTLYNAGDQKTSTTGGWISAFTSGDWFNTEGTLTMNTSNMKLFADCYKCMIFARTKNKINVSDYTTLSITTTAAGGSSSYGHARNFGLCNGSSYNGTGSMTAYGSLGTDSATGTYNLTISNNNSSYYICAYASGVASSVTISKVVLK